MRVFSLIFPHVFFPEENPCWRFSSFSGRFGTLEDRVLTRLCVFLDRRANFFTVRFDPPRPPARHLFYSVLVESADVFDPRCSACRGFSFGRVPGCSLLLELTVLRRKEL